MNPLEHQAQLPDYFLTHRMFYGHIDRANVAEVLNRFDFAQPEMSNGICYQTTVPQQAFFLMNNPLVIEQVRKIVERTDFKGGKTDDTATDTLRNLPASVGWTFKVNLIGTTPVTSATLAKLEGEKE